MTLRKACSALFKNIHHWHRPSHRCFSLKVDKCYINGEWISAKSGDVFDVTNPATGDLVGQVPDCNVDDTNDAISAANTAFSQWKQTTAKERSRILKNAFELHKKYHDELSHILTDEGGKVISESKGEILYGASYFEWFAEEARRIYGDIIPPTASNRQLMFMREPVGVAAIITPWNFPNAMLARKVAAVIAAGCTCVIKPAEDTPYSSLAIVKILEESGVPPGVVNIVTASRKNSPNVGNAMSKSPDVQIMSFTGSTAVGKLLMEQSASTVKKLEMELGGNAPFIVFESADVDKAVAGAMVSKFRHNGQTCVCTNRFIVHESLHDSFVEKFAEKIKEKLRMGDPKDAKTILGPLINKQAVEKVEAHVSDAVSKGGRVITGGQKSDLGSNYFEPTLITNITSNMLMCQQETFGPVAGIVKFRTEEEALKLANMSRSGLAGYFYSDDHRQIWRVSKKLEVGMVGVNEGIISSAEAAFGGIKESGLGREGSQYGLDTYVNLKYVCLGDLA